MIYTAKEGIEGKTKERFLTAELIIVPLIMFGVTAYGLMGPRGGSGDYSAPNNASGVTLGSSTEAPGAGNSPNNGDPGGSGATTQDSASAASSSSSSSPAKNSSTTSTTSGTTDGSGGGSGGSSCPCQTIGNVIKTLQPPPPPTLPPPPPPPITPLAPTSL